MATHTERSYKVGTWNVRGLSKKKREVFSEIRRENLDVVVLTETKLFLEQEFGEEVFEDYIHLFSGKKKMYNVKSSKKDKTAEHASGGVSILLKKEFSKEGTREFPNGIFWGRGEEKPERLIFAALEISGRIVVVIGVYWLDNCAENSDKDNFQQCLEKLMEKLVEKFLSMRFYELIILGDFNSWVGMDSRSDVVGRYGSYEINNNGNRLITLCKNWNLKIQNTFFNHEDKHKYTWYETTKRQRSLIDFCITKKDTRYFFEDVLACRWLECGTDHIFLEATFSIPHLVKDTNISDCPKYRTYLLYSKRIRALYQTELNILCNSILDSLSSCSTERMYELLESFIHEAAHKVLGSERKNELRNFLWDQEIRDLREFRQRRIVQFEIDKLKESVSIRRQLNSEGDENLKENYFKSQYNLEYKKCCANNPISQYDLFCFGDCESDEDFKEYKNEVWEGICSDIDNKDIYRSHKVAWNIVNDLKIQSPRAVKMHSERFIYKKYQNSFVEVPPADKIYSNVDNSLYDDICNALDHLDDCNIPVPGGLTIKLLRYSSKQSKTILFALINRIFCGEEIPQKIKTMYCDDIPRSTDGEPLEFSVGNGFMHSIMRVMREVLKKKLEKYASFEDNSLLMPVEYDWEATFVLRQILQKNAAKKNPSLQFVFIDLINCFLDIEYSRLFDCLAKKGVPNVYIKIIEHLYSENIIRVRDKELEIITQYLSGGLTFDFSLSCTLLKIYMKEALYDWSKKHSNLCVQIGKGQKLLSLFLSDFKLVIVSEKCNTMTLILDLNSYLNNIGLNLKSANIKHLGKENIEYENIVGLNELSNNITIEGKDVININDSILQLDGKNNEEIWERILETKEAIGILHSVARDEMITKTNKISIFGSIIQNLLLHGCETWTITDNLQGSIEKTELSYWKWCYENFPHTYTPQELYKFMNVKTSVLQTIQNLKEAWYYHIVKCKSKNAQWIKDILDWQPDEGSPNKTGPKPEWLKSFENINLEKDSQQPTDRPKCFFCVALERR